MYIEDESAAASLNFLFDTSLGKENRSRGLRGFLAEWLGNSRHLWMWDYKSIASELENAGFVNIRRAVFGDASDRRFDDVEEKQRWENCLGAQCEKV